MSTQNKKSIALTDWIRHEVEKSAAIGSGLSQLPVSMHNSMALCSDYLMSALRVAHSLADQICKNEGGGMPTPASDWVDNIVVYLHEIDGANFYHTKAELLPFLFEVNDDGLLNHETQCIYSLGLVFYVIFSGGERPMAELEQQKLRAKSDNKIEKHSQELLEDLDPLPFDQDVSPADLAGILNILDDNEDECNLQSCNITCDDAVQSQNPSKRLSQNIDHHSMCAVSVERLKVKGLPGPLCNLVANMIDCIGFLGGKDSYCHMFEVRSDLQLMLDKPAIYLYDQDMGRFATTGLRRCETMCGRTAELSAIIDAYRWSVSSLGESKSVIISGPSGSGKSVLAHEIGKYVAAEGGIFLYGKFDQSQKGKPFSALASAFDDFCCNLIHDEKLNWVRQAVACQVITVMGPAAYHLTKIIPNLAIILGLEPPDFNHDDDCVNAQKRLQYLLRRFVQVISISSSAPVTLCLDNLQRADAASIAAVNQLLFAAEPSSQKTPFFFLGCFREVDIVDSCNPLWEKNEKNMLWRYLNARSIEVKLGFMDEETVNTMVSETLFLSPRLTRAFSSVIYRKTKGNPLFVSQLMLSLSKEGILRPSLIRRRWEWDNDRIQCHKLPDDLAMFLTRSIGVLSEDVKSSLCVLSCFGASVEITLIKVLEKALDKNLLDNLDVAVSNGLLDKIDYQYRFSHDLIQEAAYNMMTVTDQCIRHFQYGIALSSQLIGVEDDDILFTAANQLNLGGPESITGNQSQIVIVANLNLRAGKKAIEMSDFETAYSYFDHGITFLRKNHWKEHYSLSLELFDLASKCALANGDVVSLTLLSDQVLLYGHSFEDKLNVLYYTTCSMASSLKLPESIEKGLDILSKLGIDLRGYDSSMEACVQETKDLLSGVTDDEILNTRQMSDPTMIVAMKFLGKLEVGMNFIMPKAAPSVSQRIIQLSLSHGLSPVSPIGFVHFGSCAAKLGDISEGYRYAKLALSLLDKVGSRESAGEVISISTQLRAYIEPLQAVVEYHNDGYAAAMASGDINTASLNSSLFCYTSFLAGVNLQMIQEKYTETQKMIEERNQGIILIQNRFVQRSIFKLIGVDEEQKRVPEEENILATNNGVLRSFCYMKSYNSFMFRSYDDTKVYAEKYFACSETRWANLSLFHAVHAFYFGLLSFWVARKSWEKQQQQQWYQRGNESKLALKRWAETSKWTFENKWYLLEAEESYCNNDFKSAKSFYGKAISSAKDHKFVNEEALAYELAAYFYLKIGDKAQSIGHLLHAHEKYQEWGAFGKCNSLFEFVQSCRDSGFKCLKIDY